MLVIENEYLRAEFCLRGAAIASLIYKPLDRHVLRVIPEAERNGLYNYNNTVVGPIANRIAGARYSLAGCEFVLDKNEGENCRHSGAQGLSELDWICTEHHEASIRFIYDWPKGQGGFGAARYEAEYTIEDADLVINLRAWTETDAAINLAPHLYFLADEGKSIDTLKLKINAKHYLPVNAEKIPTGEIAPAANTAFDFSQKRLIGKAEIDHNFCLDSSIAFELETKDLQIKCETNQKGLQIYTGEHIGRKAIAIEPQGWPNAVNEKDFPSQKLNVSKIYLNKSCISFEIS